jgi:hypothetical protein
MANLDKYKKKKKSPVFPVIAALLVVGCLLFLLEKKGVTNFIKTKPTPTSTTSAGETINYTPTSPEEQKQIDDNKTNPQTPPTNTQPAANTASITSAKQDGNNIVVQTKLTGEGWKSCSLSLTLGGNSVVKTAETLYSREFSTCAGFSVPTSELAVSGTWQVSLTANKLDGTSVKAETVQVNVTK